VDDSDKEEEGEENEDGVVEYPVAFGLTFNNTDYGHVAVRESDKSLLTSSDTLEFDHLHVHQKILKKKPSQEKAKVPDLQGVLT
jgi:hypothetical protein